jgi:hypothetical protein
MQPPISPVTSIFGQFTQSHPQSLIGLGKAHLPLTVPQHSP